MPAEPATGYQRPALIVVIAITSGLVAAFHMGKIPAALPAVKAAFRLDLLQAGLVVSSFSLLAAVLGIFLGALARGAGERWAGAGGLVATAIGAMLGSVASTYPLLLASRLLEGLGFLMVAVTMPGLINRVCNPARRAVALGVWGAFIPAAMSLMLLVSPLGIEMVGWRGLWQFTAAASLALGLLFLLVTSTLPVATAAPTLQPAQQRGAMGGALVVSLVFTGYSALFAAVTAFLPTYWAVVGGLPLTRASHLASLVVIGNIAGNITAGFLVGRGVGLTGIMRLAMLGGGACAALVFSGLAPLPLELVSAWLFTFLAGLLPGAVFAHIGAIAPDARSIPLVTGMIFQGAGIGQVVGPLGIGAAAESGAGWAGGAVFLLALSLLAVLLTLFLPRRFSTR